MKPRLLRLIGPVLKRYRNVSAAAQLSVFRIVAHGNRRFDEADGSVSLFRRIHDHKVIGSRALAGRFHMHIRRHGAHEIQVWADMAPRNIDPYVLFERKNPGPVLQERHRFQLGKVSLFRKFPAAHHLAGMLQIQVRIFKQTRLEYVSEQPGGGPFKAAAHGFFPVFFTPHPVSLQHRPGIVVSAELIHTGLQSL